MHKQVANLMIDFYFHKKNYYFPICEIHTYIHKLINFHYFETMQILGCYRDKQGGCRALLNPCLSRQTIPSTSDG
jgi:hypothetical protein